MCPVRMKPTNNNSFMSLFVIFLVIGGIMVLANNLLDRINISLMSCGVNSLKGSNLNFPRSTIMKKVFYENKKGNEECPMEKIYCSSSTTVQREERILSFFKTMLQTQPYPYPPGWP